MDKPRQRLSDPTGGFPPIATIDMNALHDTHLLALIHNVSDRVMSGPNSLPAEAVRPGFGASRGTVTRPGLAPLTFGERFKECLLLALRQEDVADAYVFFLFDDFEQAAELIQRNFYALTFAKSI